MVTRAIWRRRHLERGLAGLTVLALTAMPATAQAQSQEVFYGNAAHVAGVAGQGRFDARATVNFTVPFGRHTPNPQDRAPKLSFGLGVNPQHDWRSGANQTVNLLEVGTTGRDDYVMLTGIPLDYGLYAKTDADDGPPSKTKKIVKGAMIGTGIVIATGVVVIGTALLLCSADDDCFGDE